MCCAFVGLDNKLYKLHGTYSKIHLLSVYLTMISIIVIIYGSVRIR